MTGQTPRGLITLTATLDKGLTVQLVGQHLTDEFVLAPAVRADIRGDVELSTDTWTLYHRRTSRPLLRICQTHPDGERRPVSLRAVRVVARWMERGRDWAVDDTALLPSISDYRGIDRRVLDRLSTDPLGAAEMITVAPQPRPPGATGSGPLRRVGPTKSPRFNAC